MTAVKRCPRCGQLKVADQFYRRRHQLALSAYCRPCQRAATGEQHDRRRQNPGSAERLRAVDRVRQRRRRGLRRQGGDRR